MRGGRRHHHRLLLGRYLSRSVPRPAARGLPHQPHSPEAVPGGGGLHPDSWSPSPRSREPRVPFACARRLGTRKAVAAVHFRQLNIPVISLYSARRPRVPLLLLLPKEAVRAAG